MSSIGSDPHLGITGLDRLGGQAALDDLQRQSGAQAPTVHEAGRPDALAAPVVDAGERLLQASAWEGVPGGDRQLPGDLGFESALGALELSQAADQATAAVLEALG